ncbi:hypothetical protein M432DRAFT_670329 [Thermoascus aurantiacus ATCC 26904]
MGLQEIFTAWRPMNGSILKQHHGRDQVLWFALPAFIRREPHYLLHRTVHGKVGRQADRTKHATEKVPSKSYKNSTPCPDPHHHHRKDLDKARRLHVSPALPCPLFLFQIDKDVWVLVRFASYSTWPNLFSPRPVLVLVLALWLSRLVTVLRQHCGWTDVKHSTIRTDIKFALFALLREDFCDEYGKLKQDAWVEESHLSCFWRRSTIVSISPTESPFAKKVTQSSSAGSSCDTKKLLGKSFPP